VLHDFSAEDNSAQVDSAQTKAPSMLWKRWVTSRPSHKDIFQTSGEASSLMILRVAGTFLDSEIGQLRALFKLSGMQEHFLTLKWKNNRFSNFGVKKCSCDPESYEFRIQSTFALTVTVVCLIVHGHGYTHT
jgi:hypothetical protein